MRALEDERQTILHQIEEDGKHFAGRGEAIRFLKGHRLTQAQAIKATCYMCSCQDSGDSCGVTTCPLFPFMAYNPNKISFTNKKGKIRQKKSESVDEFLKRMEASTSHNRGVK